MTTATEHATITSVIAAAAGQRTQGPYRAVMMKKEAAGVRLVWKADDDGAACDFKAFVERVLPSATSASGNGSTPAGVLGLDSADVAFYRIDVPPVGDHQLAPIVRMQAESLLPLPADRMQVAWRADAPRDGKRRCAVAAARTDQLRAIALDVKNKTSRIILNTEAVVKAWTDLFENVADTAVLIRMRPHDAQILLVEQAVLRHAVTVDICVNDLDAPDAAGDLELFVHDVRNALELFDGGSISVMPVFVIAPGAARYEPVVAALQQAGIDARLSRPAPGRLRYAETENAGGAQAVDADDICEYLEAIGLGLVALDGATPALNLFDGLLGVSETAKRKKVPAIVWATLVAAVVAIACLAAWSVLDRTAATRLADPELSKLIDREKTRQLIASRRPDVLQIIAILTEAAPQGMLLDNFEFKQGDPVAISSFAKNRDELYQFEKKLDAHPDIAAVKIVSSAFDEKQNRINFKMEFNYKSFSEKASVR